MQPRNPSQYSTNPHTGLPEYGFFSSIGNIVRGVTNAVGLTSSSSGGGGSTATPSAGGSTTAGTTAGTTITTAANRGNLKPREWFDDPNAVSYLSRYQDVAADPVFSQNPYLHYTQYGKAEGKTWGGTDPAPAPTAAPAKAAAAAAAPAANSTTAGSQAAGQESGGGAGGAGTPSYPTSQYMGASAKAAAAAAVAGPYDQQSAPKTEEAIQQAAAEEQQGAVKFVTPFTYVDEYGNLNSKELETPFSDAASNARRGQWGSTVKV